MSYILIHNLQDEVYGYNESNKEVITIGKLLKCDTLTGCYTIEDNETGKLTKVFFTAVHEVGEGPVGGTVNELDRLNPNAQEAITALIKEEFLYLARHMLDHSDEYFLGEAYVLPKDDLDHRAQSEWVKEKASVAIQQALIELIAKD